jgi:small subunit ribosomal protein S8
MSALTDPIADFLTRIRNASRSGKAELSAPFSKIKADIARILKQEGYISEYEVLTSEDDKPQIKVVTKFVNRAPAITGLKRVSKPGLRKYVGAQEVPRVLGGLGITILSTPKGVMSGREAKKENVGGELLAFVW